MSRLDFTEDNELLSFIVMCKNVDFFLNKIIKIQKKYYKISNYLF